MKKQVNKSPAIAPVPIAMVSCGTMEKANITPIAWTGILNSEPPIVYIAVRPFRHSNQIIKQTGEFVINLPTEELVWEVDYCGTKSGKDVDKFETTKLTKEKSTKIEAPSIKECPIQLECKVKEIQTYPSHEVFIAEVVAVNAEESYIAENGSLQLEKANLLTYVGTEYKIANKTIAKRGICKSR